MALTKRHFQQIAAEFKEEVGTAVHRHDRGIYTPIEHAAVIGTLRAVAGRMASVCKRDNPAFRMGTFLEACGLGD